MKKTIVLLPGDGIGPEVTRAAATVLRECAHEFHHQFDFEEQPVGGAAIDVTATPLPNATLDSCRKADAVFLGAVGGTKWDSLPVGKRPASGGPCGGAFWTSGSGWFGLVRAGWGGFGLGQRSISPHAILRAGRNDKWVLVQCAEGSRQ